MKKTNKLVGLFLALVFIASQPITAMAAAQPTAAEVFAGYAVTIHDTSTPAVDMRGRPNVRDYMCFVSADDTEIGVMAYNDFQALLQKHATLVNLPGGGSYLVPPDGSESLNVWLAGMFNEYRGLERHTSNSAPGNTVSSTADSKASAQQFYANYDLKVYDWQKTAVCFGSYIVVGNYECQVFYDADGYIIGVIYGDWPAVDWQIQIDHFNAYRGLASVKGYFPDMKSMEQSGIPIYDEIVDAGLVEPFNKAAEIQDCLRVSNLKRADAGVHDLVLDDDLSAFAEIRAKELVELFSHTRPDGSAAVSRSNGVSAENISASSKLTGSGASVAERWFKSDGHRKNMLGSRYTRIGIGCYQDANGHTYWVQVFA